MTGWELKPLGEEDNVSGGVLELDADLVTSHWHLSNGIGFFPQWIFVFAPRMNPVQFLANFVRLQPRSRFVLIHPRHCPSFADTFMFKGLTHILAPFLRSPSEDQHGWTCAES